jgi:hypothetical protein
MVWSQGWYCDSAKANPTARTNTAPIIPPTSQPRQIELIKNEKREIQIQN